MGSYSRDANSSGGSGSTNSGPTCRVPLSGRLAFASAVANGQKAGYGQITASDNDFFSDNGLFDEARKIGLCR
jgi:hypothetical protein